MKESKNGTGSIVDGSFAELLSDENKQSRKSGDVWQSMCSQERACVRREERKGSMRTLQLVYLTGYTRSAVVKDGKLQAGLDARFIVDL
jgi:hypothetical protein